MMLAVASTSYTLHSSSPALLAQHPRAFVSATLDEKKWATPLQMATQKSKSAWSNSRLSPSPTHAHRHPLMRATSTLAAAAVRQVATYRSSMEAEVKSLKEQLDATTNEAIQAAVKRGRPLPDDFAAPLQMATTKALRQVTLYGTSMDAEVESLRAQLESASKEVEAAQAVKEELAVAVSGAKELAEELAKVTRQKEMHHNKAREFYAEAAALRKELDELRAAGAGGD